MVVSLSAPFDRRSLLWGDWIGLDAPTLKRAYGGYASPPTLRHPACDSPRPSFWRMTLLPNVVLSLFSPSPFGPWRAEDAQDWMHFDFQPRTPPSGDGRCRATYSIIIITGLKRWNDT